MSKSTTLQWNKNDTTGPDVLQALTKLTHQPQGQSLPATATVLTLLLFVKGDQAIETWAKFAQKVSNIHPARILLINPIDSPETNACLDASITLTIQNREGVSSPILFSEFIQLTLKGGLRNHWIDLIQPFIKSDLPSYLWWIEPPPDSDFRWDLLASAVDHLIIDSSVYSIVDWGNSLVNARHCALKVSDINWMRNNTLRYQWADVAEVPEGLQLFRHPQNIQITASPEWYSSIYLNLGWLSHQLQWLITPLTTHALQIVHPADLSLVIERAHSGVVAEWNLSNDHNRLVTTMDQQRIVSKLYRDEHLVREWCNTQPKFERQSEIRALLNGEDYDYLYDETLKQLFGNVEDESQ